jgi:hypothetical protein
MRIVVMVEFNMEILSERRLFALLKSGYCTVLYLTVGIWRETHDMHLVTKQDITSLFMHGVAGEVMRRNESQLFLVIFFFL